MFTFITSIPISRPRQPNIIVGNPNTPCLTIEPPTSTRPKQLPSSPLTPSQRLLSTPLPALVHQIFTTRSVQSLTTLPSQTIWNTPLFDLAYPEIPSAFTKFFQFAVHPTITIHDIDTSTSSFTWTLSFNYPLPWRPRVSVAGITKADSLTTPTKIIDDWYQHPLTLITQAFPRLPDIIWLYPGPHAEVDDGLRRLLKRGNDYKLYHFSPRAEIRVEGVFQSFEKELLFAAPTLPETAFEGGLRRREKYAAVAPIGVRVLDEDTGSCEWAVPVPSGFCGSGKVLLPLPGGEGVRVENVGGRVMAVVRFGGFAMRLVVERRVEMLLNALREDGVVVVGRERVWVRVYDCKVGFNERGLLAMAMYGSSTGVPRVNEIAVDLTGCVDETFWKR